MRAWMHVAWILCLLRQEEIAPACVRMDRRFAAPNVSRRILRCVNATKGISAMRCLFAHKWVTLWEKSLGTIACCRRCRRCGTLERAVLDAFSRVVAWETMRERSHVSALQMRVARQQLPRLDRLAHSLGFLRTRTSDRPRSLQRLT